MLKFNKINGPWCCLSAFCSLHPEMDYDALLREYSQDKVWNTRQGQVRFFSHLDRTFAMHLAQFYRGAPFTTMLAAHKAVTGIKPEAPDLTGRGVLYVALPRGNHAVAFEAGKILDPDFDGTLETWEEFYARESEWVVEGQDAAIPLYVTKQE